MTLEGGVSVPAEEKKNVSKLKVQNPSPVVR